MVVAAGGSDGLNHSLALVGGGPASPAPSLDIIRSNGVTEIVLHGEPRKNYVIEHASQFGPAANWSFNQNVLLTGPTRVLREVTPASSTQRFYRARFIP